MLASDTRLESSFTLLCGIVEREAAALLDQNGVECTSFGICSAPEIPTDTIVAMIGFAGEKVRGRLAIVTSQSTAAAIRARTVVGRASPEVSRDFLGELSNLLVGRLKLRLMEHDIVISVTIPETLVGSEAADRRLTSDGSTWLAFESPLGSVFCALRADITVGVVIGEPEAARAPYREGDVIVF